MAGHEQRHDLVAELPVGHPPAALLVLGVQEHREQIAPVLAALAALGDDREEDPFQPADRPLDTKIQAEWEPSAGRGSGCRSAR